MREYYENQELRKSSCIILILALLSILISFYTIDKSYEGIKDNYVDNNAAVVGKIVKIHPELKNEVVTTITKDSSEEDIKTGRQILKDYSYSTELNISLMPQLENNYRKLIKSLLISMVCFFAIVFLTNTILYIKIYKKLEMLILAAKNILDYNFDIGIYENAEGTFAKLAHAFDNMRVILKNNFSQIQHEKDFLVNTLSDISHQIKTPISSLIIYNDILLNRKIDDNKKNEFLENSKNQLNRIEWLVKSLLQLAKLDAGAIKFKMTRSDINETVMESLKFLEIKAESKNVKLEFYPGKDKIVLRHDPNWISEAIVNIIKNAIEHTESGGKVTVFTEVSQVCIRIIVKDNGEGIPEEEVKHVFERFYKGKMNKSTESIGIGLALSKSIIEGNGGMIDVKSKIGKGTVFTVTFLNAN